MNATTYPAVKMKTGKITAYRLQQLIEATKIVGRIYISAVLHPMNYPELTEIADLSGLFGLRVACCLTYKEEFLFHESQLHRLYDDENGEPIRVPTHQQ